MPKQIVILSSFGAPVVREEDCRMQARQAGRVQAGGPIESATALGGKGCLEGRDGEVVVLLVIADPLTVSRRRITDDPWHRNADRSVGSRGICAQVGRTGHSAQSTGP